MLHVMRATWVFLQIRSSFKKVSGSFHRYTYQHCRDLGIRRSHNKYRYMSDSCLSYCKKRKKEGLMDKDAQASYTQDPWKAHHAEGWDSQEVRYLTLIYIGLSEAAFHDQKGFYTGKRKYLKAGRSVTVLTTLTVIIYVPSWEVRKQSPLGLVQKLIIYRQHILHRTHLVQGVQWRIYAWKTVSTKSYKSSVSRWLTELVLVTCLTSQIFEKPKN